MAVEGQRFGIVLGLQDVLELVEGEVAADACQKDSALLQYFAASAAVARELIKDDPAAL